MAFLRTLGSVLVLLLYLLHQAKCELYHITSEEATDDCSSCITLSQLAANAPIIGSNLTLVFLPGSHNLTTNLSISDISYLSMEASNDSTAQITCELTTSFSLENVQYLQIRDLDFFGCGSNLIKNVAEFVLQDVVFEGHRESGTSLKLVVTAATLTNSTFISNTNGTLSGNGYLHPGDFSAGGAIIAVRSNITITDCTFERNRAEVGGAIYAEHDSTISIESTTFVENQALVQSSGMESALGLGGVLFQESGSVTTVTNCLFANNSAPNLNGGVFYSNKSDIVIKASKFADNTANRGAILCSYNGSISVDSSQFDRNTATWGGVVHSSNSNVLIDRSQFHDNRAMMRGGIVDALGGTVALNDSQFYRSRATWGGVLYVNERSRVMVSGSQFNDSTTTGSGGVIYSSTGNITIQGTQFYNNSANSPECDDSPAEGGVLYSISGNVHIRDSQFHSNAVTCYGGALFSVGSSITISNSQFHSHKATYGGVVYLVFNPIAIIEGDSQFDRNLADYGGVIHAAFYSTVMIREGSEFSENTAGDQGGAIYIAEQSTASINNSYYYSNSAANGGGALYCADGEVEIEGSKFKYNGALRGGAIDLFQAKMLLKSTEVNSNVATSTAGALYCESNSDVTIQDSVMNNNTATSTAGALYCKSNSDVTIQDSIMNNNTATVIAGALYCESKSDVTIQDSIMNNNVALLRAGTLYSCESKVVIRNSHMNHSRVIANVVDEGIGGVLFFLESTVEIFESIFHNNTAVREGGVVYSRRSDIIVNGSHFSDNAAILNGGVMYTENDNVTIYDSFFKSNPALVAGVMYANNSNVSVDMSQFVDNSAMCGGVIDSFFDSIITLERSQFYDNRAEFVGAIMRTSMGSITISQSQFDNNTCTRLGGVFNLFRAQITITESYFNENRAAEGSVLYAVRTNIKAHSNFVHNNTGVDGTFYLSQSVLTLSNTSFTSNVGSLLATDTIVNFTNFNSFENCMEPQIDRVNFDEGGALTAFQSTVYFEGTTTFYNNQADNGGAIRSIESVLNVTGTTLVSRNSASRNGGGVYLSRSEIFCEPNSSLTLENNTASRQGGGLFAIGSSIKVSIVASETLLNVEGNLAERGGGLSFDSNAKLYILKRDSFRAPVYAVQIYDNSADYGGALYVNDGNDAATCESPSTGCFLQVLAIYTHERMNINTVALNISNNLARKSVSSATLYGGLLDRCTVSPLAEVHSRPPDDNIANYVYNQSGLDYFAELTVFTPNTITSDPVRVCFCFNGYPDCSHLEPVGIKVKKGESFVVSLIALDQIGQPVTAAIQSSLMFAQSGLAEGQLFQDVTDNCTDLTFNVFSPNRHERLTLYADGPCSDADISSRSVAIQFLRCTCPIGLQPIKPNDTTCECRCHQSIVQYVITQTCDVQTGSFVRRLTGTNVWFSYSNSSGYLIYPNCPYDYCKHPNLRTSINLNLPNGSDALCAFNRVSVLCGSCKPGLSLSLGSSLCLRCPRYWPALLVIITLAAALAGVALVAFLLLLNLTVATGTLNGIIFYANIVAANRNIFPYQMGLSFASVFISFLNLDIGIDTCFFEGMTTYTKTWLQVVFPLYVILLVVLLIVISSYSSKFSNLIGKKDPVATLATLILLSYARLLGISFIALSPGTLVYEDGSRETVWLPDATVNYFGGVYVPLFIAAFLIVILGLVYTIIVLLWQWLVRLPQKLIFAWTRNQKLQIFIETYNIPYTPHHRYWTGMLLLVRAILYLIATLNVSNDPYIALTSVTFIIVCILCLKGLTRGRVFKHWPVDLLETFFYFNLLFLTIFTWYSLSSGDDRVNQTAVINVSVVITFIVLLLVIVYHIYSYTPIFKKFRETKYGKRLDEAIKSLSVTKTKQQRKIETSEDNLLLDLVYKPTTAEGYSSTAGTKEQRTTSQSEPTQSVIELPIRKSDFTMETTDGEPRYVSNQDAEDLNRSSVSNDAEKPHLD